MKDILKNLWIILIWLFMTFTLAAVWGWAWSTAYNDLVIPMTAHWGYLLPTVPWLWWFSLYIVGKVIQTSFSKTQFSEYNVSNWNESDADTNFIVATRFLTQIYNGFLLQLLCALAGIFWV